MLNKSNRKTINVDSSNLVPIYTFKQEDDGVLLLSLFKNSIPLDLTGQSVKLGIKRPNGTIVSIETLEEDNPFNIDQNNLDIKFKNSAFAIPGVCECDLELVDVNGKMTTASFYITVNKKVVGDTNIKATNDIAILDKIKLEEEKREAAEDIRIENELVRSNAEDIRVSSENTRVENENLRRSSEETRVLSENERVTNEEDRKTKETERLKNEEDRLLAETTRGKNEETRVLNEENRVSKENERVENETDRVKSESDRVAAENDRVSNETERKSNEQKRVSAEEERETNEIARQTAYKEIQDARVDYFGTGHNNLEERLNEDFDNIHQRVNESSLLPYEGTNITADNSYYGLVKDLSIKGRTLQNLVNINDYKVSIGTSKQDDIFTITTDTTNLQGATFLNTPTKANTTYTVFINVLSLFNEADGAKIEINNGSYGYYGKLNLGLNVVKISTSDIFTGGYVKVLIRQNIVTGGEFKFKDLMVLEGDYTNTPLDELPYVQGIKSTGENEVTEDGKYKVKVKSCGKNLFNINNDFISSKANNGIIWSTSKDGKYIEVNGTATADSYFYPLGATYKLVDFNNLVIGKQYNLSVTLDGSFNIGTSTKGLGNYATIGVTGKYDFVKAFSENTNMSATLREGIKEFWIRINEGVTVNNLRLYFQLEEGTVATDYEPYKEQIIEYLLDEPHMGLPNGAEDIIDLDNGKLVKRIGKVVFNGSEEKWTATGYGGHATQNTFEVNLIVNGYENSSRAIRGLSNKFAFYLTTGLPNDWGFRICRSNGRDYFLFSPPTSVIPYRDTASWKTWLSQNPVTIYYELPEPIITQLEKPQLFSQDTITHITSDNLLPPTISCKIPSNIPAVISTLRLENEELQKENTALTEQIEENNIINIETSLEQDARLTMLELGVN